MNIHEYQAKRLLKTYGLPVSEGVMVESVFDAEAQAKIFNKPLMVVKAQIHAGGRGKAGGVVLCKSVEEVKAAAEKILHKPLITHQTGPQGQIVRRLYIEDGANIDQEFYLSFVLDRAHGCMTIISSREGGTEIEEVAKKSPEKITKTLIYPATGIMGYHVRHVAKTYGLNDKDQIKKLGEILTKLYQVLLDKDADLIEINPFVLTTEGNLHLLDAKISFEGNALFKHPDIEALRDEKEEDALETLAREQDLNYIKLDGNIGCMVNGAGLAMATMDLIKLCGAEPANFLDVGGTASQEKVETAFKIILSDKDVKGILVNIFGGIMKCDIIAHGIIAAAKSLHVHVPLVVRLQGTNSPEGQKILRDSGLNIKAIDSLDEASEEIVKQVQAV
ncbi:MAG: ADP-forming succinate--CoA ligase subunit beta [Alphaproteobacteria bacterium CG_4_10_14_0_8_um_filter_37_21]|nr:MAG: ADP-forming succinate--CoA ligase subunit beta [Alphaproteobacteria bacterium CG_4_10_14_0_8_um_filter_37_21]